LPPGPPCSARRPAEERIDSRAGVEFWPNGQLSKDGRLLWRVADSPPRPLVHRQVSEVVIVEDDVSSVGPHHPDHQVEAGRFARAIGTQQSDDFAFPHLEVDAIEHAPPPISFHQAFDLQLRAHRGVAIFLDAEVFSLLDSAVLSFFESDALPGAASGAFLRTAVALSTSMVS